MEDKLEPCAGCGDMSNHHPMVGVTRDEDGKFAAFPVCGPCWRDPKNRKVKLKMHFFDAFQADIAVAMAGSEKIG